jgi:NAD(P)-dependent dehydrogenase (short-subunit alcohol dehydrogenase family)
MDVKDKTILVTGATDGIGRQTALDLARMGAHVLIHGRSKEKGIRVLDELNRETCNEKLALYVADFSSLADVRRMADEIKREQSQLHVLVNNAGSFFKGHKLNADGLEMTFVVNHLASFLLTNLLLDLLKESAPARVVTVASGAHRNLKVIDWENLQGEKSYDEFDAYALSKLASVCTMNELADRLAGSGVTVNTLHPGVIETKLLRMSYNMQGASVEEGAQTSVYLATEPEVEGVTGKYFSHKVEKPISDLAGDPQNRKRFWDISEALTAKYMD